MAKAIAFSASGQDTVERKLQVQIDCDADALLALGGIEMVYEIDWTAEKIISEGYQRIALQFPDDLLHASVPIYSKLKAKLGPDRELYILADTSYGSCCVDEVAAQHVNADALVHYGHACMSQASRLSVLYVFGKKLLDVEHCVSSLCEVIKSSFTRPGILSEQVYLFLCDVAYAHVADTVVDQLRARIASLSTSLLYTQIPTITNPRHPTQKLTQTQIDDDVIILYVGEECPRLTNLLLTHSSSQVHVYMPKSRTMMQPAGTNKLLMRRYAVVQKAKEADVFGILVGTLGVASYLPLISHLRALLSRARKKAYTISVGKLNPAKLANFMEIECFVLVACTENSLIESKDFFRPIVTPYELEIALRAEHSWTGRYVLEFERLLAESDSPGEEPPAEEDAENLDQPIFSLVTGKYRHARRFGAPRHGNTTAASDELGSSSALVMRDQNSGVSVMTDSAAGSFLQTLTYQGLERRVGEDRPSILEQGRSGIARGYQDDHGQD